MVNMDNSNFYKIINGKHLLMTFIRTLTVKIDIAAHIQDVALSDWHMGKITSLFFGEQGLNRPEFDVGTDNSTDIADCKRNAIIRGINIEYYNFEQEKKQKSVNIARANIMVEYPTYSTKP